MMLETLLIPERPASALKLALILAVVSLMTVLAGMVALGAKTCATVMGTSVAVVASFATAGGEIETVELFLVLIVGEEVLVAVIFTG